MPCLQEEADTRIFARAREADKRPSKKISSCAVDVVVLVIPVVQQLRVDEQRGCQKSPAIVDVKSNCLAFFFIHSQGAIKHPSFLVPENGG